MTTHELEDQPAVAVENEYMDDSSEDAIPREKSGVKLDPNPVTPNPRFYKGDMVHMSEMVGSSRIKGVYQVYKSRYSRSKGYTEYQLMVPLTQSLHKQGAWFRERDLKMDR